MTSTHDGRRFVAIDDLAELVDAYRDCDAKAKEWNAARDFLKQELKDRLGDAEVGTIAGRPAVRWTRYPVRDFSRKQAAEILPVELYQACLVWREQSKFTVVDERKESGRAG